MPHRPASAKRKPSGTVEQAKADKKRITPVGA